ncbi:calcineurin-like phosphoesterase family protein [Haloactinopolyspora alba]|uniref:Calcineurin-like phosphoesterase family protein n=1 Tax=Haloactinopolyspora alba TaxID=648780 RepID=A0A2P8DVB4_9ACTN|nr:metallophosphoesterase [Haloactinopolyspora alba]PSL01160.1 calcineurin-like phosphoesterase family protein [Haloactinopolyspora alba]
MAFRRRSPARSLASKPSLAAVLSLTIVPLALVAPTAGADPDDRHPAGDGDAAGTGAHDVAGDAAGDGDVAAPPRPGHHRLWRESFNGLADDLARTDGYTHEGPRHWSVEIDPSMTGAGVAAWRGWSFTTREFWVDAEDQKRGRFGRADQVIAVADSDEYADTTDAPDGFDSTLVSAPVRVRGRDRLELTFDSHYRQWAGQAATVTVEFDGSGEQTTLMRRDETNTAQDDPALINGTEVLAFDVPDGARQAVFRWRLEAPRNSWYWAIDSVAVRTPLPQADPDDATSLWVVSDIQGHPGDLAHGLRDLHDVRPDASGLLMVGDLVNSGAAPEWREIDDVMAGAAGITPDPVVAAIGNHESYSDESWDTQKGRFLDFARRDKVWGEYVLHGDGGDVPVLVLGQEYPRPPEVGMSDEQVAWFDERLDYWTRQRKQVVVITHFPLGDTVSASWIPWYHEHHGRNDQLTRILGDHPNAVLLTGHTHYPFESGDWAVRRRVPGGHPDGFVAVNTGAMHVEWDARGESTEGISEVVTRDINRGLTLDVHSDRIVVNARDFGLPDADGDNDVNDVLRTVEIGNPLLPTGRR